MRALLDTDAFCKLAVAGVLDDAVRLLGTDLQECGRLAALPYMLRRGRLRKVFGDEACDALIPVVEAIPVMDQPSDLWLEKLALIPAIDPGEAQIFAAAAETGLILVSGDKRALRALKNIAGFADVLAGRIVTLEAILIALCDHLGSDEVRHRVQKLTACDNVVSVCFSRGNADPRGALLSYQESLGTELHPLVLWDPRQGGGA
jgi:hypothetical protein